MGTEGVLRAHVPASPLRAQLHSPTLASALGRTSHGAVLAPPQGLLLLEARRGARPSGRVSER